MKKLKLTLWGVLMGMVITVGGCIAVEPLDESVVATESTDGANANNIVAKETKETEEPSKETEESKESKETEVKEDKQSKENQFSDEYLVGFDFGGSSWGSYYDCVSVSVIICTNKDVLVMAPSIESAQGVEKDTQQLAKLTLSEEQYANITKVLDREKLYNMKINSNDGVCDGSSYALILYDQDEKVAKVCGAYEPTTRAFLKMYEGVMDNIPKDELRTIRNQYVNELENYYESDIVMNAPAKNCYQAYYDFLTKVFEGKVIGSEGKNGVARVNTRRKLTSDLDQWKSFGLLDVDGDKVDELIVTDRELGQSENDDTLYLVVRWTEEKIYAVEVKPRQMQKVDFTSINYQDKYVMPIILQAESENSIEGITKEERTFYFLITTLVWLNDNYTDDTKENVEARKDYSIVSDLGERTDFRHTNKEGKNITYQYRMNEVDVRAFYELVMDEAKDFEPGFDSSAETGVYCSNDGYLYSNNETSLPNYVSLDEVEKVGDELILRGTAWDAYNNDKKIAYVTVSLIEDYNKYGYRLAKSQVERIKE